MTLVAVLGGIGILPVDSGPAAAASLPRQSNVQPDTKTDSLSLADSTPTAGARGDQATSKINVPTLPANSGSGRRIVFAMADQRVWLVGGVVAHDAVLAGGTISLRVLRDRVARWVAAGR